MALRLVGSVGNPSPGLIMTADRISDLQVAAEPTIWGLSPGQLHDRFWAARGIQVVRWGGEGDPPGRGAELYMLVGCDHLAVFDLGSLLDTLFWTKPQVLCVRLSDVREHGYREWAQVDLSGRFAGFRRSY